jgi:hypothetical protein
MDSESKIINGSKRNCSNMSVSCFERLGGYLTIPFKHVLKNLPLFRGQSVKFIYTLFEITREISIETIIQDWAIFGLNVHEQFERDGEKCDRILFSVSIWNPFRK